MVAQMASRASRSDITKEALRAGLAALLVYSMIGNLSVSQAMEALLHDWRWSRLVLPAVVAFFVYRGNGVWRGHEPYWRKLLWCFYGLTVMALVARGNFGTAFEDVGPPVVIDDFELERNLIAARAIFDGMPAAALALWLSRRRANRAG